MLEQRAVICILFTAFTVQEMHTLKPVGNKPRRPSQHGVTTVNTKCNKSMYKCILWTWCQEIVKYDESDRASRSMLSMN